ncbi:ornithine carbamoyltransferase [Entophlyctis luteolus]|nr:ornithine carbamoyltransferase [Entophlyctis luteolus]
MTLPANNRHLLTLKTLSDVDILALVHRSLRFKARNVSPKPLLAGKTLGLLFTKKSTRTRISGESAWAAFGGHPMFLGAGDIQLGDPAKGGESWRDTAQVVGSMVDAVFARLGDHAEIEALARHSAAPVINALTSKFHPMQALADIMTIYEAFLPADELARAVRAEASVDVPPLPALRNVTVAWVGDANNIINSLLVSLPRLGVNVALATPAKYPIDADIQEFVVAQAADAASKKRPYGHVSYTTDPSVAVRGANVIVTDTWVSMGQEAEKAERLQTFKGYKVTEAMAREAAPDWKFMHCLPRKLEEVDDDVFYSPRSLVFGEAENRKWTAMAVFEKFCAVNNKI